MRSDRGERGHREPPAPSPAEGGPAGGDGAAPEAGGTAGEASGPEAEALRDRIVEAIRTVYDPEIPVNIYELGMVYEIRIDPQKNVAIRMTLTSPACPVAGILPGEVEYKVRALEEVNDVEVELVWDPPWTPAMMSEAARLQLNM